MKNLYIKKLIAVFLIVANIFATNSFNVLAFSINTYVDDVKNKQKPVKNYYYLYSEETAETIINTTIDDKNNSDEEVLDENNQVEYKNIVDSLNDDGFNEDYNDLDNIDSDKTEDLYEPEEENEEFIEEKTEKNIEDDNEKEEETGLADNTNGESEEKTSEGEIEEVENTEKTGENQEKEQEKNDINEEISTEESLDKEKDITNDIEDKGIIATESDIDIDEKDKKEENFNDDEEKKESTNSEIEEVERISTASKINEDEKIEKVSTNSEILVSTASETKILIATYSKITWKIEKIEVATLSNIDIYDSVGNTETKENLAKTAKIKLINNLGEEKTIEVDLKWNLYKHIEIATNSKSDVHKFSIDKNWQKKNDMKKLLKEREVLLKATDSKSKLLEKIKREEEDRQVILIENNHNIHKINSKNEKIVEKDDEKEEDFISTESEIKEKIDIREEEETEINETEEDTLIEKDEENNEEIEVETEIEEESEILEDVEAFTNVLEEIGNNENIISTQDEIEKAEDVVEEDIENVEKIEENQEENDREENDKDEDISDDEIVEKDEAEENIEEIEIIDEAMQEEREVYISKENVVSDSGSKDGFFNTEIDIYELDLEALYVNLAEILFDEGTEEFDKTNQFDTDEEIKEINNNEKEENVVLAILEEDTLFTIPMVRANLFMAAPTRRHLVCGNICMHDYIEKHETQITYSALPENYFATTSTTSHVTITGNKAYYLVSDTIINTPIEIVSGAVLHLCLEGHNLTFEYSGYLAIIYIRKEVYIYGNGTFTLTNCAQTTNMVYGTYTEDYIDIYGNVDTGGAPITRYRAKPFADVENVGIYAPNSNISFENIRTVNWYNNNDALKLMEDKTPDHPSSTNGGGALFKGRGRVELSNLTFKNIYSRRNNGTIANSEGKLIVENCVFDTLESVENAAALCFNTADTIIYKSTFKNCISGGDGGALYGKYQRDSSNGTLIKDCSFTNCSGYRGGAIGIESFKQIDFEKIKFYENNAAISGGALYICIDKDGEKSGGNLNLNDVEFIENEATKKSGGAIHIDTEKSSGKYIINLDKAEFNDNKVQGIRTPIYKANVRKNYTAEEWFELDKNTKDKNTDGDYYSGSYGGAITAKGNVKLNIGENSEVDFKRNKANTGGTIFLSKGTSVLNKVSIKEGKPRDNAYSYTPCSGGGAIYAMAGAIVDIGTNSSITNSQDALYALDATFNITNPTQKFTGNDGHYLIGYSNNASNNIKFKDFTFNNETGFKGDDIEYDYYEVQKAMIEEERNLEGEGKGEFKKEQYYLKTTIQFEGMVNIKGNQQRIGIVRTEADIYYDKDSIKLDFSKTKFDTENKIGLYLDAEERVIIDYWNRENILEYNQGFSFSDRFYLDNREEVNGWNFYRDNEKIYVGENYNTVNFGFYINGSKKNPSPQYIYNKSTGSYLDKPKEIVNSKLSEIENRTFLGFIGYVKGSDENEPYKLFDFETSKALPDTAKRQYYYGIYTNDEVKCKACGTMNDEKCNHVETDVQHKNRGVANTNSEEAKYLNYVVVATAPQLYYKYNNKHTQYVLEKDIIVDENLPSIKGNIAINLAGHRIYSNKRKDPFINLTNNETATITEDDGMNVFITSSKYSTLSDAIGSGNIDFKNSDGRNSFIDVKGKKIFISNMNFINYNIGDYASAFIVNENYDSTSDKVHLENVSFKNINAKTNLIMAGNITLDDVTADGITTPQSLFETELYEKMVEQKFVIGGATKITNNTLNNTILQFEKSKLIIASNANVQINNNKIEKEEIIVSVVQFLKDVEIDGCLNIQNNTINFTGSNLYLENAVVCGVYQSKDSKVTFGNGGLKVINNKTATSGYNKFRQYYVNRPSENMLGIPVFYQKAGTKLKAEDTEVYLYIDKTDEEQLIYENYNYDTVENFANSEDAQIEKTFILDSSYGNTVKIYNIANDVEHIKILVGKDFVKADFILVESNNKIIDTQYVKKGQNSILERPFNSDTTINGEYRSMFYEGPTKDYLTTKRLKVYSNDFNNNIVNMTENFEIYAYYSAAHNHTNNTEPFISENKNYWIQARNANHFNCSDGCIYLNKDMTVSEALYEMPKDNYSICLNGHTLTFEKGINWFTENENVNITITDCKKTGVLKGSTATMSEVFINMERGTLNLSNINLSNMKINNDLIKISENAKVNINNVNIGEKGQNVLYNNSSLIDVKGKAYIDGITIKNNTYEKSPLIKYNFATMGNVVKNNTVSMNRGGVVPIIFDTRDNLNIETLIINSNYLTQIEGASEKLLASAVVFKGVTATISNMTITSNISSVSVDNGAIYVYDSSKLVIDGVNTINKNTLKTYGALNIEKDSTVDIIGTVNAAENKSDGNNGTVISLVATPNVTDRYNLKINGTINITKNTVNDTGAIFINGGRLIAGGKIIIESNNTSVNSVQKNIVLNKQNDYLYGNSENKLKDGSKIYITNNVSNTKVFDGWSEDYIEDFNKIPYYYPDKIFYADNGNTNQNIHIYKQDETNIPKLYVGENCVKLTYRDTTKKVLFTQYVAKNILTTIEKVEFPTETYKLPYDAQWWKIPSSDNEKITTKVRFYDNEKVRLKITEAHNIDLADFKTKLVFEKSIPESPLEGAENVIAAETYEQPVSENELIVIENPNYDLLGYELIGFATRSVSVADAERAAYKPPFKVGQNVPYDNLFRVGMADPEVSLYCVWIRKTITLTININDSTKGNGSTTGRFTGGGSAVSVVNVKYDSQISGLPTSGSRNGYNGLLGFASISYIPANEKTTSNLVFKNGDILRVPESKEIYAVWENASYTCTIDLDGGEYDDDRFRGRDLIPIKVYFDEKYTLVGNENEPKNEKGELLIPKREGYEFHFYSDNSLFKGDNFEGLLTKEDDAQSRAQYDIANKTYATRGNSYIYATWTPAVYEVTFDANGDDDIYGIVTDGKISSRSITYKVPYSYITGIKGITPITTPRAVREGFEFKYWLVNTRSDREENILKGTDYFLKRRQTVVYAHWEELSYNLVYQSGNETKQGESNVGYAEAITVKSIEELEFTKVSREFRYWFIDKVPLGTDGKPVLSSNIIRPGDKVSKLCSKNGETVYLKAVWDNQYIVHYKPNGGHSETFNYDMLFTKGQYAQIQRTYGNTDSLEFRYYNTVADDTGVRVIEGSNASNLTDYSVDGIITLYCVWKQIVARSRRSKGGGGGGGSNASQVGTTGLGSVYTGTEVVSLIVNSINGLVTALDENGSPVTGWKYMFNDDGASYYHFNSYGKLDTGWYSENGNLYYLDPKDGKLVVGETYVNGILYNFKENGALDLQDKKKKKKALQEIVKTINQPIQEIDIKVYEEGKWEYDMKSDNWKFYVVESDGSKDFIKNDWFEVYKDGKEYWYLTDVDGNMMKGWVHSNGAVYYLREQGNEIGTMVKGMSIINNETYAFDENGKYIDDLTRLGDIDKLQKSYSFVSNVAFAIDVMATIQRNMGEEGAMNQNILNQNNIAEASDVTKEGYWKYDVSTNNWSFYLTEKYADGTVNEKTAKGWTVIDGEYYCFDEKGGLITGLVEYEGNYYYLDENPERRGRMFTGTLEYEGNTLYFDPYTGKLIV